MSDTTVTSTPRIVRRSRIDTKAMTITITQKDSAPQVYPLSQVPFATKEWLMLRGLQVELMQADDPQVTYTGFVSGIVPETTPAAVQPALSKTRQAIIQALANAKARRDNPTLKGAALKGPIDALIPEMTTIVRAMAKEKVRELENTADVQEQYSRLFGAKPNGVSLLDMAGLTQSDGMELAAD